MKAIRNIIIIVSLTVLFAAGLFVFALSPRHTIPILMYHYIDDRDLNLSVTPRNFQYQMDFLRKHRYNVIGLNDLVEGLKKDKELPRNTIVITFDDGHKSVFTDAFPILNKYSLPATVFIITSRIGLGNYLSEEQILLMAKNGIQIGSHSHTHVQLPGLEDHDTLMYELTQSKKTLEGLTEQTVEYFCYPIGRFNYTIKKALKEAGYKGACTTNRGYSLDGKDVYELRRIKMTNKMNNDIKMKAVLSGYYKIHKRPKSPY